MEVANSGIIIQNRNLDSCLGLFGFFLKKLRLTAAKFQYLHFKQYELSAKQSCGCFLSVMMRGKWRSLVLCEFICNGTFSWCRLETLSLHIDLLQRSVLQMDFLQRNFVLSPPLLLLGMGSSIVNLYLDWKVLNVLQNGSRWEHTAVGSTSFEKWNKKLLIAGTHECW